MSKPARDLIARSRRLGSDPKNTNFAGGNTSAKGKGLDPVTGANINLLWVKGSGGDLGTLSEEGLAVLQLDRVHQLKSVYPGLDHEDQMVAAFEYCAHGKGGAAPSIDTAMHALVDAAHVDHLHPDSGIAIATATDGKALTAKIFGSKVAWVPWRRPGFQLGLDMAEIKEKNPDAVGCILGGHGITAWGDTSDECEKNSLWIINTAQKYIDQHGKSEPFGTLIKENQPLATKSRHERAAALAPLLRGLASTDKRMVGHYCDDPIVLDFLARAKHGSLAALGTSCPDHFLRTKVRPMVVDLPPSAPMDVVVARIKKLHQSYRANYAKYYEKFADADSPAMRGADPLVILVPGIGMFSYGPDKKTARVASEFYINAINVMRGAEALSSYKPISEREKFRIEYWALEEAKLQRLPKPKSHATKVAFVTGAASGIGKAIAHRLAADGAQVVIADVDEAKAKAVAAEIGSTDVALGVAIDVRSEKAITSALSLAVRTFGGLDIVVNNAGVSLSKPLLETTEADWDFQHDIMAKGSFLVSRETARILMDQEMGGDVIYISSKNSVFAGPNNIAYSATKADQAHQVRLLAVELGEYGIRVNGINPDGVVRGSGIFAAGWGANRAKTYGVKEEDLGNFYAQRTILKKEVLPESIADAVSVLTGPDLTLTTGMHLPVDSGVAAAFLR
ncbi:MAG: bifunctional aldolase/short-chain dehydrogenase [Microbacteriaceae bacterium]|nr:bifunctional aldolase/short-chain dehydrogenase [Microbacteriaceae bacterium]